MKIHLSVAVLIPLCLALLPGLSAGEDRPNVLFIAMDDLNDWIGCMKGHPQTITPNLDRLAASGVLFNNAHCAAPACNPSRTAIFTGISPQVSGIYENAQKMRDVLPKAEILSQTFRRHGYRASGSGKMLHYFIDAPSWDEYFPEAKSEFPLPFTLYPKQRPLNLPRGGPWQYVETDWGPLDATDREFGGDFLVAEWITKQLKAEQEKPFFLACGIYRPHEPWFVPKKYFEPFPLDKVQLPPGYLKDDLDDLPPEGKRRGANRYFAHIREQGQWKQGVQSYLASIHFADAMLGKVLDALDASPYAKNTIVVLWSDHGWHLGEKQHWQKYTGWRACTRVPLIVRVPQGTPSLTEGTHPSVCQKPVSLLSLAPTLLELCGLPAEAAHDGVSLKPLLENPNSDWANVATTFLADRGSYSISGERFRLVHYANGEEEFYDISNDPYEWKNLAGDESSAKQRNHLRSKAPIKFAAKTEPKVKSLSKLRWVQLTDNAAPASKPDGNSFDVFFRNSTESPVRLHWMNREGKPKLYGGINAGKQLRQKSRPGAVWMITDAQDNPIGYFRVGDRSAQAVIPD